MMMNENVLQTSILIAIWNDYDYVRRGEDFLESSSDFQIDEDFANVRDFFFVPCFVTVTGLDFSYDEDFYCDF